MCRCLHSEAQSISVFWKRSKMRSVSGPRPTSPQRREPAVRCPSSSGPPDPRKPTLNHHCPANGELMSILICLLLSADIWLAHFLTTLMQRTEVRLLFFPTRPQNRYRYTWKTARKSIIIPFPSTAELVGSTCYWGSVISCRFLCGCAVRHTSVDIHFLSHWFQDEFLLFLSGLWRRLRRPGARFQESTVFESLLTWQSPVPPSSSPSYELPGSTCWSPSHFRCCLWFCMW